MNSTLAPVGNQPVYEIANEDRARHKRICNAWKAYEGDMPKPFDKMPNEPDMNVLSNRIVEIINTANEFLFGKELQISAEQSAPKEAQKILDDTWGRKEARIPFLLRLGLNGAMSGNAFLRIVPGQEKKNPDGSKKLSLRLVEVDPAIVL